MPGRVDGCERAREWIHEACDERRPLDAEQHVARCPSCQGEAALLEELAHLLAGEPAVQVPADLVPGVMALVKADITRARRNARLAYAGAVAALVALAFGVRLFDVVGGATALGSDALSWAQAARAQAPGAPDLRSLSLDLPAVGYGWAALALAALIVVAQIFVLAPRAGRAAA